MDMVDRGWCVGGGGGGGGGPCEGGGGGPGAGGPSVGGDRLGACFPGIGETERICQFAKETDNIIGCEVTCRKLKECYERRPIFIYTKVHSEDKRIHKIVCHC